MIEHRIFARHHKVPRTERLSIPLIKRCISTTLNFEGVDIPCEVSVLITDDEGIKKMNRDFRRIDSVTDVLSFPFLEYEKPGWSLTEISGIDKETGVIALGDIVLNASMVDLQAREHSQSRERETMYLTIHSVLHLLGYDHIDEAEDKKLMRNREKAIERVLGGL